MIALPNPTATGWPAVLGLLALLVFAARPVQAVDGVIEINQASAIAGGVIPSDGPGFPVELQAGSYRLTSDIDASSTALQGFSNNIRILLTGYSNAPELTSSTHTSHRAVRLAPFVPCEPTCVRRRASARQFLSGE